MQEGAGVRQVIEDELRAAGRAAPRPRRPARARPPGVGARAPCSAATASRSSRAPRSRPTLAAGRVAVARVEGLEPSREISLVRAAGRAETRVAQAFVDFARERLA